MMDKIPPMIKNERTRFSSTLTHEEFIVDLKGVFDGCVLGNNIHTLVYNEQEQQHEKKERGDDDRII